MSEYYDELPLRFSRDTKQASGEEFIGSSWSVRRVNGGFMLQYLSGELAGRLKEIEISEADFQQLKSGAVSCDDICMKYNAT